MTDLHPLVARHPDGHPTALVAASDWLRHVEADGSRVVVLPPDAVEQIAAYLPRSVGLRHRRLGFARAVLAALGVEQDDECFACHGTGTFEPSADEPPERRALTCAECKGTGVIGGEHPGATAYHCPDCTREPCASRKVPNDWDTVIESEDDDGDWTWSDPDGPDCTRTGGPGMTNGLGNEASTHLTASLRGPSRWTPPDEWRVPINVHPDVRDALRNLLLQADMRSVGYSEFIWRAVEAARTEDPA